MDRNSYYMKQTMKKQPQNTISLKKNNLSLEFKTLDNRWESESNCDWINEHGKLTIKKTTQDRF